MWFYIIVFFLSFFELQNEMDNLKREKKCLLVLHQGRKFWKLREAQTYILQGEKYLFHRNQSIFFLPLVFDTLSS